MAEVVVSTVISCVVTELIKVVIKHANVATMCRSECRRLEKELEHIEPDVEKLERRLEALQKRAENAGCGDHEDLQMVAGWLHRLKAAIEMADIQITMCNSGLKYFHLPNHQLSVNLKVCYDRITKAAENRINLYLQLGQISPEGSTSCHRPPQSAHQWYESPGESARRQMAEDRIEFQRREVEAVRQQWYHGNGCGTPSSANSSLQNGTGYDSSGWSIFGEDSSSGNDSSGHGWRDGSSVTFCPKLMSLQRTEILLREDRTRNSMGHSTSVHHYQQPQHLDRRHTIANPHGAQLL